MGDAQRDEFAADAARTRLSISEYFSGLFWGTLYRFKLIEVDVSEDIKRMGNLSMFGHRRP